MPSFLCQEKKMKIFAGNALVAAVMDLMLVMSGRADKWPSWTCLALRIGREQRFYLRKWDGFGLIFAV